MKTFVSCCFILLFGLLLTQVCPAQEPARQPLKLEQAIELALANYPALRVARAQKLAAQANVELARTSLLPRADLLAQENRATRNNVFGLLLPQSTLPSISGPDLGARTLEYHTCAAPEDQTAPNQSESGMKPDALPKSCS